MSRKSRRKHANGEGGRTIRKGGLRQYTFYVRQPDGTKRRIYRYFRDKSEGEAWLAEMRLRAAKGELIAEADTPLADYIDQWIKDFCINLRPSTRGSYELYMRHIRKHPIGKTPLRKLTTTQLQDYIRFLLAHGRLNGEGGLSEKSVRNLMQMLNHALKQAVGCNLIGRNPAEYVVLPKVKRIEIEPLTKSEVFSLIHACPPRDMWGISIVLLATTGIRLGELLALRHDSVVKINSTTFLDIKATLQRVPNVNRADNDPKTVLKMGPPKTDNGYRQIPVIPEVADYLKIHMDRKRYLAERSFNAYAENPFLISDELGNPVEPSEYRKWFRGIVEKAGIQRRVYPHLLRHTWASMAVKADVDLKSVSDTLGHYDTAFSARRYIHPDLESRAQALGKMEETFKVIL